MEPDHMKESLIGQEYYFFINTKSGKREGTKLMDIDTQALTEAVRHICQIKIVLVDLFDQIQRKFAIQQLKNKPNQSDLVRVIICGGDGTIHWVMNELTKHDLDLRSVAFGVLPIGTGNDFCRSIGWNPDKADFTLKGLIKQLGEWEEAIIKKYDLWDVHVETYKNGRIYDIKDCKEILKQETEFRKVWTNYVGIGLDARVVYTVEKNRTSWPTINKICYALVGCFNCIRPMKELRKKISSFSQNGETRALLSSHPFQYELSSTTNSSDIASARQNMSLQLKNGYRGMVCLNSNSYMAGLRDVWKTTSMAVRVEDKIIKKHFREQHCDDGLVEFVAYKNELGLALERVIRGGSRVTQGSGPFEIRMRRPMEDEITHMQIDGEAIKIVNLKSFKICRSEKVGGHQINILSRRNIQ